MAQGFYGSICLTDIPKDKITVSEKNGKKYLNISLWVNDELDQYQNVANISVSQTKDEREAKVKKTYIGNLKYAQAQATAKPATQAQPINTPPVMADDLPF